MRFVASFSASSEVEQIGIGLATGEMFAVGRPSRVSFGVYAVCGGSCGKLGRKAQRKHYGIRNSRKTRNTHDDRADRSAHERAGGRCEAGTGRLLPSGYVTAGGCALRVLR